MKRAILLGFFLTFAGAVACVDVPVEGPPSPPPGCDDRDPCQDPEPDPADPDPSPQPEPPGEPEPSVEPEPAPSPEPEAQPEAEPESPEFTLSPAHLPLPFAVAGQAAGQGELVVIEAAGLEGVDPLSVEVEGPFEVEGSLAPLRAGERRIMVARFVGDTSAPVAAEGVVRVEVGGLRAEATVAAVIGDRALPAARWQVNDYGRQAIVALPSAPYPHPDGPWTDSSVLIFAPDGLKDAGPVSIVAHLHGLRSDLAQVVASQRLVEQHALSGRDAIFIAPQGPYRAGSNDFGKLDEPGGFARLARDAVAVLYRDGLLTRPLVGEVALTAHSGGYKPTARILEGGGLPIRAALLFDALYGELEVYRGFVEGGGVLRSNYTATGGTVENNEALAAALLAAGTPVARGFTDGALLEHDVAIVSSGFSHNGCLRGDRSYERWLRTSGLARNALAPPELLVARHVGNGRAEVIWRDEASHAAARVRVEGSEDGEAWEALASTEEASALVPARPWLRVVAVDVERGDSTPSDAYGATGARWLIVDGFDRATGGSWLAPSHVFAAALGEALGAPFSTASNEAVAEGLVDLEDFEGVVWLLGDESVDDVTFDALERSAVEGYLAAGGRLIVSGAEVGYATDPGWAQEVLGARYVADDAGSLVAGGYRFGVAYEEDYPDALDGQEILWRYEGGQGAAVGRDRQVIVVGFGLETIAPEQMAEALGELVGWLR